MDARLLDIYDEELDHLRGRTQEFTRFRPETADQLSLGGAGKCPDPQVERLLQGVAFLSARIRRKLEAEYPELVQGLLETLYPDFVAPFPACGVVRFLVGADAAKKLLTCQRIPRETLLRGKLKNADASPFRTTEEFRFVTAHPVELWPVRLTHAEYLSRASDWKADHDPGPSPEAGLAFRLELPAGLTFDQLQGFDRLTFFLTGHRAKTLPARVYEAALAYGSGRGFVGLADGSRMEAPLRVEPVGFNRDEALLLSGHNSFQGYRLLREFFGYATRFMFFRVAGFGKALARCKQSTTITLMLPLTRRDETLESEVTASLFELYCTPVINRFEVETEPIPVSLGKKEFEVVPDRDSRFQLEVLKVSSVEGQNKEGQPTKFVPFFLPPGRQTITASYFTAQRRPFTMRTEDLRQFSRQRDVEPSLHSGSEVHLSLLCPAKPLLLDELQSVTAWVWCCNRFWPNRAAGGTLRPVLQLPVACAIDFVDSPVRRQDAVLDGELVWRLISHLSMNHLSLLHGPADGMERDAAVLREALRVYSDLMRYSVPEAGSSAERLIESIDTIAATPTVRLISSEDGPPGFIRGLAVTLTVKEKDLAEVGTLLFGMVIREFLARFVGINSFVDLELRSRERGHLKTWTTQIGQRSNL